MTISPILGEGAAVAAIGAVAMWLTNRLVGRAAFNSSITEGFDRLNTKLEHRLKETEDELEKTKHERERNEVSAAKERAQLRGEVTNLVQIVIGLEDLLRRNGIDIPERRYTAVSLMTLAPSRPPSSV